MSDEAKVFSVFFIALGLVSSVAVFKTCTPSDPQAERITACANMCRVDTVARYTNGNCTCDVLKGHDNARGPTVKN